MWNGAKIYEIPELLGENVPLSIQLTEMLI